MANRQPLPGRQALATYLERRGLTQAVLAASIGISRSYLSDILRGKSPGRATIGKIASATDDEIPTCCWFGGDDA